MKLTNIYKEILSEGVLDAFRALLGPKFAQAERSLVTAAGRLFGNRVTNVASLSNLTDDELNQALRAAEFKAYRASIAASYIAQHDAQINTILKKFDITTKQGRMGAKAEIANKLNVKNAFADEIFKGKTKTGVNKGGGNQGGGNQGGGSKGGGNQGGGNPNINTGLMNVENYIAKNFPKIKKDPETYRLLVDEANDELAGLPIAEQMKRLMKKCDDITAAMRAGRKRAILEGDTDFANKLLRFEQGAGVFGRYFKVLGPLSWNTSGEVAIWKSLLKSVVWLYGATSIGEAVMDAYKSNQSFNESFIKALKRNGKNNLRWIFLDSDERPSGGDKPSDNNKPGDVDMSKY